MRTYRNGRDFEDAVFGCQSDDAAFEARRKQRTRFGVEARAFLTQSKITCPDTKIGRALFRQVERELIRLGVSPDGLIFLPTINTTLDFSHGTDALFFLPSLPECLVTVDAFNINPEIFLTLRESWIDSFNGKIYSDLELQSHLFLFKRGMLVCVRNGMTLEPFLKPPDFRFFADYGRAENHFVLTPYHTGSYRERRGFAKMVAGYFAKEAAKMSGHKTAQQRP